MPTLPPDETSTPVNTGRPVTNPDGPTGKPATNVANTKLADVATSARQRGSWPRPGRTRCRPESGAVHEVSRAAGPP